MILGVDYYPEHWPADMLDEDIKRIVSLGANTVRIGEFAWHMMEPEEGRFDFAFFDNVIEKLKANGLQVIFGTPTATFPAWLAKKYPLALAVDENGRRHTFGGRRLYCYNAPEYKRATEKIVTELLTHYQSEEAIIAWQIDNELGHEGSDQCYCDYCQIGFQKFLKDKYLTIAGLNDLYGTIFWGQTYNNFDEIPAPKPTITTHNPSLMLDWARFRSESINTYAAMQIEIVNRFKRPAQKVTHNLFGGFFDRAYDQNVLAENLDVVSYDNYPVWGGLEQPLSPSHIAMTLDYIRGLKQQNFWILEQLMGAQGHTVIGYLPRPNQAKLWSYQAMARGCDALLYFRWRGMTRGAEQFCQGILDSDNQTNDKFLEVKGFFEEMQKEEKVFETIIDSEVALLYDYDNRWSWAAQPQSHAFDFTAEFVRLHAGFHKLGVMTDVIDIGKDFSPYKVVVLPVMQIVDKGLLSRLETFAAAGGTVVFGFRSGIKDKHNNLRLSKNILNAFCGIELSQYESLGMGQSVEIEADHCQDQDHIQGHIGQMTVWRDLVKTTSAKAIYRFTDTFFDQYAAVTVNEFGVNGGNVYYIGGGICEETLGGLVKSICKAQGIDLMSLPNGVEVVKRGSRFVVMNHTEMIKSFGNTSLNPYEAKVVDEI